MPSKKIVTSAIALACNISAYAGTRVPESVLAAHAPASLFYKSGFYAGLAQGISHMRGNMNINYINVDPIFGNNSSANNFSFEDNSYIFEINGGYRHFFKNNLSLGFDVALSRTNNQVEKTYTDTNLITNPNRFELSLKKTYSTTPSLTLGYRFNDAWHVFGKVGVAISKIEANLKHEVYKTNDNKNKTYYNFVSSLGIEYALKRNISVMLVTSYEKGKDITIGRNNITPGDTDSFKAKISPSFITQKIGIIYRF